ncbi:MAG: hypothetical protein SFX73_09275 [Kofleriaceae bacterium]|nr:hypothetical protein [Kofleriaceae bacterium]
MSASRLRRVFASPFVVTIAACGGKSPPPEPVVTPVVTVPVDAAPVAEPPDAIEVTEAPVVGPGAPPIFPVYRNPPPPQHKATRDLTWKITKTGTGDEAKCKAQQVEACQKDKQPCKPPIESHLCVLEDSSKPESEHHKYPLLVVQKQGDEACYVKDSNPPERTYCPDEWALPKK